MKSTVFVALMLLSSNLFAEDLLSLIKRTPNLGKCYLEAMEQTNKNLTVVINGMVFNDVENREVEVDDTLKLKHQYQDHIEIVGPTKTYDKIVVKVLNGEIMSIRGRSLVLSGLIVPVMVQEVCRREA